MFLNEHPEAILVWLKILACNLEQRREKNLPFYFKARLYISLSIYMGVPPFPDNYILSFYII